MSIGVAGGADDAIPVATSTAPVRADVDAARTRVEQARSASARAKSAAVPPMAIGVQYQSDGGSVDLGPMLTVALPLWNRNQAGIGSAKGDLAVAEAELAAITARAAAESRLGRAAAEAAVTTAARLDGTDVAAAEGLALVDLAFQKGELDVRDAILLGRLAALDAIHSVTATRLAALLAEGDPALLAR